MIQKIRVSQSIVDYLLELNNNSRSIAPGVTGLHWQAWGSNT